MPVPKAHQKRKSGRKASKKKTKKQGDAATAADAKRNPKAFVYASKGKAAVQRMRTADRDQKRLHGMSIHPLNPMEHVGGGGAFDIGAIDSMVQ